MILCVLLTLLAAAGLLLNALLDQEIGRMIRADIDFANVAVNSSVRENSPDTRGYRTIALVGVDSRDESEAGGNSDTMMILSIHKDTGEVRIASGIPICGSARGITRSPTPPTTGEARSSF